MKTDSEDFPDRFYAGICESGSLEAPRPVAISSIIEKLRQISNRSNQREISELNEAIEQLELKQIELEHQNHDLKEAYERLEQVCERYYDLYEASPSGYVTIDRRLMVIEANGTAARQLETEVSRLIGSSFLHRMAKNDHERFLSQISKAKKTGTAISIEVALERHFAPSLDAELTILPMFTSERELLCYRMTIVDVSERRSQHQLIEEQKAQLLNSTKLALIGEMAANIAHEINNPLAIIVGMANVLTRLVSNPTKEKMPLAIETAEKIESTAFRIAKIVKSLQRLSTNSEDEPLQIASLKSIFEDAMEMCQGRIRATGTKLIIQPITSALEIECRPVQIAQVLLNLLNNAVEAVKDLESRWIRVSIEESPSAVAIWISDSGPMPPGEVRARMFEPFFTTKPFGSGSGLGLSVSRAIIQSHGGNLSLDLSAPNTSFRITLPKEHR